MTSSDDDDRAIRALVDDLTARWNRKDAAGFAELFTDDATFTDVLGQIARGRADITVQHRRPFEATLKHARLDIQRVEIRLLRPDVASVDVAWATSGHTAPHTGEPLPRRNGLLHVIALRERETWQFAVAHNMDYTATYRLHPDGRNPLE